ncbi:MAG: hypothetical protein QFX40_08420 [Archaeoglobales archaeon]|nr:hypothetical protein [Archaeoglobales archaeon]
MDLLEYGFVPANPLSTFSSALALAKGLPKEGMPIRVTPEISKLRILLLKRRVKFRSKNEYASEQILCLSVFPPFF